LGILGIGKHSQEQGRRASVNVIEAHFGSHKIQFETTRNGLTRPED
jgi:hypothetical protein